MRPGLQLGVLAAADDGQPRGDRDARVAQRVGHPATDLGDRGLVQHDIAGGVGAGDYRLNQAGGQFPGGAARRYGEAAGPGGQLEFPENPDLPFAQREHNYFFSDEDAARAWQAERARHELDEYGPLHARDWHLYEVKPPEQHEPDPEDPGRAVSWRSTKPLRVVRKLNALAAPFTPPPGLAAYTCARYHGTYADLEPGDYIEPGHERNYEAFWGGFPRRSTRKASPFRPDYPARGRPVNKPGRAAAARAVRPPGPPGR